MNGVRIGCSAVRERITAPEQVPCCDSCHDDFEQGFADLIEIEPGDRGAHILRAGETAALICCSVLRAIDDGAL